MAEDRNLEIVALRKGGAGCREIARHLGLTPSTVSGVLHRSGLTSEPKGRVPWPASVRKIIAEASWRSSINDAAREWGVGRSSVIAFRREFRA
jgi:transposase-like protein